MTYLEKAEKFIKKELIVGTIFASFIKRFARWLDDQEKSEGKKKIEELFWEDDEPYEIMRVDEWLSKFIGIKDKLNQLIKVHNENL